MKILTILFFLLLPGMVSVIHSEESLQFDLNMFRKDDVLVKQQVEYKNPGRLGENVLWNFGKLKTVNKKYSLTYSGTVMDSDSIIVGTQHQTRYYYSLNNDSLLLHGYENPTTKVTYKNPEMILHFPMKYGEQTADYYQGSGTYCDKLEVLACGSTRSVADSYGVMILPSGDTLRHVIRVRTTKLISENIHPFKRNSLGNRLVSANKLITADSIQCRLNNDSVVLMVDTYRWYAAGYRYPVFETVRTGNYRNNSKTTYFTTAFFYSPEDHQYLKNDEKNKSLLTELRNKDAGNEKKNTPGTENPKEPDVEFTYNFYPNPVKTQLSVEYYISEDARVECGLYNTSGMLLYRSPKKTLQAGAYQDIIDMNRYSQGEYILRILVNDKAISERIIKK